MSNTTPTGKTKSQGWEFGMRRTLPLSIEAAWEAILTASGVPGDIQYPEGDGPKKGDSFETADGTHAEVRSYEPFSLLRMKWQPTGWQNNSTLQIRVMTAKTGTTISIHHEWLADADQRAAMKQHWAEVIQIIENGIQ